MSDQRDAIARILANSQQPAVSSPFLLDQNLEAQAAPLSPPLNPLVQGMMQRLGLLNLIRNRRNANLVDPEAPLP